MGYAATASVRAVGLMRITLVIWATSKRATAAPRKLRTAFASRRPLIVSHAVTVNPSPVAVLSPRARNSSLRP